METSIIKIGNSHGIRIPKPVLEQCNLDGRVKLEVVDGGLRIESLGSPRQNWDARFAKCDLSSEEFSDEFTLTEWDRSEPDW